MNLSHVTNKVLAMVFASLFLLASQPAWSLSTDRDQPAQIEADDIEFDFQKGTRTYIDNVLVVQGTLRMKADKVIANYKGNELQEATAWGSLARFKQRPDGKEHDVEGWAKKIIVNQRANTLTLIGQAALKQGPDTARGDTIVYNMATDTLSLKGGAQVGSAGKDGSQKPARTLEDPFAEEPAAPTDQVETVAADSGTEGEKAAELEENTQQVVEPKPEPLKKGRSRLIIQPKQD